MSHTAPIDRKNPTCFLFLVDQSGSMAKQWATNLAMCKAEAVADAINRLLYALVDRCTKGPQEIYDYYYIGVVGYGGNEYGGDEIGLGFLGEGLAGSVLQPVSRIA